MKAASGKKIKTSSLDLKKGVWSKLYKICEHRFIIDNKTRGKLLHRGTWTA